MLDYVSLGQLIGYRVSPKRDVRQFKQMGLKANDIIMQVNGIALNQLKNVLLLYRELEEATQADLVIRRGDAQLQLLISLDSDAESEI